MVRKCEEICFNKNFSIREDAILILDDFILRVPNYIPTFAILCVENIREQATWT